MSSPTARSLEELRGRGFIAKVVEQTIRIPGGRTFKRDCFGFDILAAKSGEPALGVQACAGTDHAKRRLKVLLTPESKEWVAAGHRLAIWSWSKKGARGKRKLWQLREDVIQLSEFPTAAQPQPPAGAQEQPELFAEEPGGGVQDRSTG